MVDSKKIQTKTVLIQNYRRVYFRTGFYNWHHFPNKIPDSRKLSPCILLSGPNLTLIKYRKLTHLK